LGDVDSSDLQPQLKLKIFLGIPVALFLALIPF
jgi:hypothetical protein